MSENYFDIKGDLEVINASGFFCHACVVGKPAEEQSPDPRYCFGCYELLLKEAGLKPDNIHWILNDSVCIVDGWGFALTPNLRTVCIGKEKDVLEIHKGVSK